MGKDNYIPPKRETVGSNRQVAELTKLLLFWPQCTATIAEIFIENTLGITMTRACFQEVREALGLKEAEHRDKTIQKKCQTELVMLSLIEHHGVGGLSEQQFISKVRSNLKDQFGEETNRRLLEKWVFDVLDRLKLGASNPGRLKEMIVASRKELQAIGVLPKESSRQTQLI